MHPGGPGCQGQAAVACKLLPGSLAFLMRARVACRQVKCPGEGGGVQLPNVVARAQVVWTSGDKSLVLWHIFTGACLGALQRDAQDMETDRAVDSMRRAEFEADRRAPRIDAAKVRPPGSPACTAGACRTQVPSDGSPDTSSMGWMRPGQACLHGPSAGSSACSMGL